MVVQRANECASHVVDMTGSPESFTVSMNDNFFALADSVKKCCCPSQRVYDCTAFAIRMGGTKNNGGKVLLGVRRHQQLFASRLVLTVIAEGIERLAVVGGNLGHRTVI